MTSSELSVTSASHTLPVPKELLGWTWQTFYSLRDGGGTADTPHSCQGLSLCFFRGGLTPNTAPPYPGKTPCLYIATCTAQTRHCQTAVGERRFCLQPRALSDSPGLGTESHLARPWPAVSKRNHTWNGPSSATSHPPYSCTLRHILQQSNF